MHRVFKAMARVISTNRTGSVSSIDRIHGTGEAMECEALGVRLGARLSKREERGIHLGLY